MIKRKPTLSQTISLSIVLLWITCHKLIQLQLHVPSLLMQFIDMLIGIFVIYYIIKTSYSFGMLYVELKNNKVGYNDNYISQLQLSSGKLLSIIVGIGIILFGIAMTIFFPKFFGATLTTLIFGLSISGFGLNILLLSKK